MHTRIEEGITLQQLVTRRMGIGGHQRQFKPIDLGHPPIDDGFGIEDTLVEGRVRRAYRLEDPVGLEIGGGDDAWPEDTR